jgi:hypothetical protein
LSGFTTLDFPGATLTYGEGINDSGQIVGAYRDANGIYHGFVLSGGTYTTIDAPGSTLTNAYGINNSGEIEGFYNDANGKQHGFVLNGGSYTTIDFPGAQYTDGVGINGPGQIVGGYGDASGIEHGFLLSGGTYSTIDAPGYSQTELRGINDGGQIVGLGYDSAAGYKNGFLLSGGSFIFEAFPGALYTYTLGINNPGQIVGEYLDTGYQWHGFLLGGGKYTTVDPPGSTSTGAVDINNVGQIVGSFVDASQHEHGYLTSVPEVTTTAVTSSANLSVFGQSVTFTATVTPAVLGSGTPTGTVTFMDDSSTLGTGTLNSSATAVLTTSALAVASHSITAVYSGDSNFAGSTSPALTQVVNQDGTTTTLSATPDPSVYGQMVTFKASVKAAAPGSGTPTGAVAFLDGTTTLGTALLDSHGRATFKTTALGVAKHAITAVYSGDSNFTASQSPTLYQTVNRDGTTSTVSSSLNPSVVGQLVTFLAVVSAKLPGSGAPTGTVTFEDGTTALDTATLSGGTASFTTSSLAVGTHSITVVYHGDGNFKTSTSPVLYQIVNASSAVQAPSAGPASLADQVIGSLPEEASACTLLQNLAFEQLSSAKRRSNLF